MNGLFESIRKTCLSAIWSQGVKLAREGAVVVEEQGAGEIIVRVRGINAAIAPTVVLFVDETEASCDCGSKVEPCAHIAAAVIAVQQAEQRGEALPVDKSRKKLGYRLSQKSACLAIDRIVIDSDGAVAPFTESLVAAIARVTDLPFVPSHDDMTVDRIIAASPRGLPAPARIAELFTALAGCPHVELVTGGVIERVTVSPDRVLPRAIVDDHPGGVQLRVEVDPSIRTVVARGVVRVGDVLHPLGEMARTGELLEKLPIVRVFALNQLGDLVSRALPDISKSIPLTIKSKRIPQPGRRLRPRIHMEFTHAGHTLSVLPLLVYGRPIQARIDSGRLVHLQGEVPMRDEPLERELIHRLRDELNLVTGRRVDFDGKDALRFVQKLKEWRGGGDDTGVGALVEKRELVPRAQLNEAAFDVLFEVNEEREAGEPPRRASADAVFRAWQDGLEIVPLDGGGWAPIPEAWLAQYGHRVADLLAARRDDGAIPAVALPTLAQLCVDLDEPPPAGFGKLVPLIEGFEAIPPAPLPEGLNATLRHYQQEGVDWLTFLKSAGLGAVLADDMGLGKTLQTLCAMNGRTLVVCPKSVVYNWMQEIKRFRPQLSAAIYHGPKRLLDPKVDVTLTTYSVLRLDAVILAKEHWDMIVLDEAQAIKNPDSQQARASYELRGEFRVALSGTPVENRLEELWSLFHFTNRGLLGGRSDFQDRYSIPIGNGDKTAAGRLRDKTKPFLLRRLKRDVAPELPPRTDTVLFCELDEAERSVYDAIRAATQKDIVDKLAAGGSVLAALEALLRLRQASCHSSLIPGQSAPTSSKVDRLLEALEEAAADGHKALVFSQWTSLLDLVEPHLKANNIPFTRLDGSTRNRGDVVTEFQSPDGPPVMLVSLKAGGTGLNLTAADHVFLLDPWWNPAVEDQAADRAHRIGQERPVMVYRMVAKDTVEEGILALQERKRAIAEVAVGGADAAHAITRDDLLQLLS